MSMSTLAAILCNYNHAQFLPQALASYAEQAPWPQQLIIVDDGSTDGSRDIIHDFARRHGWVRVLLHERNLGWHASTRDALAVANADYIYNGAADDYLLPGFFAAAMELAQHHPEVGVICGAVHQTTPDGKHLQTIRWEPLSGSQYVSPKRWQNEILRPLSPWNSLSSATILKHDAVRAVGGYRPELGFWADTFVIRAIGFRTGVCYLDRECTSFRILHSGMSGTAGRSAEVLLKVRREALRLMRSSAFAASFSPRHVRWWAAASLRSIEAPCSDPLDQHYQQMLEPVFAARGSAKAWERSVLWCARKMMSGLVRLVRPVVGRCLRREIEKSLATRETTGADSFLRIDL
jgi:glycosyltransferase involved in cell wall biosynthesis